MIITVLKKVRNKIYSLFSPWSFWGSYVVFPVKMFLRKLGLGEDYYKQLRVLKNRHVNDRCFVIATGPSLTLDDLNLLRDEITIGENSIFKLYKDIHWVPTYYAMADPNLTHRILKGNNDIEFNDFAKEFCIFNSLNRREIKCDKSLFIDMNWLDHVYHYGSSKKFRYNPDIEFGIYDCYSITQLCVLLAVYMGFKEVYIIGADNNYFGSKQHATSYAGETKMDYEMALKAQNSNDWGYEFVNNICKENDVKLFNATRGGNIKCLDRVNLEDIIDMGNTNGSSR